MLSDRYYPGYQLTLDFVLGVVIVKHAPIKSSCYSNHYLLIKTTGIKDMAYEQNIRIQKIVWFVKKAFVLLIRWHMCYSWALRVRSAWCPSTQRAHFVRRTDWSHEHRVDLHAGADRRPTKVHVPRVTKQKTLWQNHRVFWCPPTACMQQVQAGVRMQRKFFMRLTPIKVWMRM